MADGDLPIYAPPSPTDGENPGENGPTLTEANLKKRDSLMMLDEEATKLVRDELRINHEKEE